MGARTQWEIRTSADGPSIYLYSHWGGDSKWSDTHDAIEKARPRWNDPSYGSRIFISQIVGSNWNEETGFGIIASVEGAAPFEESYFSAVVDFSTKTITFGSMEWTFEEFLDAEDVSEELTDEYWGVDA